MSGGKEDDDATSNQSDPLLLLNGRSDERINTFINAAVYFLALF